MKLHYPAIAVALVSSLFLFDSRAVAQAESETTRIDFGPVTDTRPHPCNGEPMVLTLQASLWSHFTTDAQGGTHNHFHVVARSDGEGASGTKYHQRQVVQNLLTRTEGADTITSQQTLLMVGQGPDDDFYMHVTMHITFNANGEPTATVSNIELECR